MKNFITLTLSFLLLFSMTACGNRADNNNNAQAPANPSDNNDYYNTYTGLYNESIGTLAGYRMYADVNSVENEYKNKEYPGNEAYLNEVRAAYEDSRDKIQSFVDGLKNDAKTDDKEINKMNEDLIREGEKLIKEIDRKITKLNEIKEKDYEKNQDEFIKYVYDKTREGEHETNEFEKMLNNMNERLGINRGTVEENNTHKTTK